MAVAPAVGCTSAAPKSGSVWDLPECRHAVLQTHRDAHRPDSRDGRGLYFRGESRMHFVALTSGATLEVVRRDTLCADPYRRESLAVLTRIEP